MPTASEPSTANAAWTIVLAAARRATELAEAAHPTSVALTEDDDLRTVPGGHPDTVLVWHPDSGWTLTMAEDDARRAIVDLYLPICSATLARPITLAHLGQSLDGFIATHAGESQFVTGAENILHLHRLRALCDAIVVGAGTVAADDPLLTTRHVDGPNPLRVVFDPTRGLDSRYRVFQDDSVETLYVCARSAALHGETHVGKARLVAVDSDTAGAGAQDLLRMLHARGCARIFIEGGGVTVSTFLMANLLDRLQVAIAPLLIGDGRPAIRLPAQTFLRDCRRPRYRVFRMGGDVLFDCELRARDGAESGGESSIARVI
jgi:diaminohydroxyphosphoribosylaminopyrimidine deaminase/5-amino-6-(5-phosphoribosylamino)uracil reductase